MKHSLRACAWATGSLSRVAQLTDTHAQMLSHGAIAAVLKLLTTVSTPEESSWQSQVNLHPPYSADTQLRFVKWWQQI